MNTPRTQLDFRVLLLGASGVLGSRLFELLSCRELVGTHYQHRRWPGTEHCDLLDEREVCRLIMGLKPDIIIHAAGMTRPDACERAPEQARAVNVAPIRYIAEAAIGAKIILFSTDYVFDGGRGSYTEDDAPRPINVYGETKLAAERELFAHSKNALVIRVAGLFGWSQANREFLDTLLASDEIVCSAEHRSSYTFIDDIVDVLPQLLQVRGLVHLVGPDVFTRAQFARLACSTLGLSTTVRGVSADRVYQGAPRPRDSSLRSTRLKGGLTDTVSALMVLRARLAAGTRTTAR